MKILHLNTERTFRGGEQQVLYLAEGIQKRGHLAHLVCQPEGRLHERAAEAQVPVFPLPMRGELDVRAAFRIGRLIRCEGYDIVHAHTAHALSLVGGALGLTSSRPLRITTRRVEFSIFRHNFLGMNRYKYTRGADHIIAISEKVKSALVRDGIPEDKVSVVHSGVALDRYQGISGDYLRKEFSLPDSAPVLGNIGFLEENKGQAFLIRALREVVRVVPAARLLILGNGRLESFLKTLVRDLGLERNVVFTGFRSDVGAFLNLFDLLVVSSVEEGLNSSILDALAVGVPVVASDAGGISEIITSGECGLLVPKADVEALSAGILWMLDHRVEAQAMARRGQARVAQRFSADAMVEGNLAVYERVVAHRRAGQ
jgi:L-malate glycosyltransferase